MTAHGFMKPIVAYCNEENGGLHEILSNWTPTAGGNEWVGGTELTNRLTIDVELNWATVPTVLYARLTKRHVGETETYNITIPGTINRNVYVERLPLEIGNYSFSISVNPNYEYKIEFLQFDGTDVVGRARFFFDQSSTDVDFNSSGAGILDAGLYVDERIIAAASIPEAAPALPADGYASVIIDGGNTYAPAYVLCIVEFDGCANQTVDLEVYGYSTPPAAGGVLLTDWILLNQVEITAAGRRSFMIPLTGFSRFQVIVTAIGGAPAPNNINIRHTFISNNSDGNASAGDEVNVISLGGNPISQAFGVQNVAVPGGVAITAIPQTDVNVAEVGGVAVSAALGVQDVAVPGGVDINSIPQTDVNVAEVGGTAVTAEDGLPVAPSYWYQPQTGGHQTLNIAAAAVTTAGALTVGSYYKFDADADCYYQLGVNGAIAATAADTFMRAGSPDIVRIEAGRDYVSVIRRLTDAANGFHISKVS